MAKHHGWVYSMCKGLRSGALDLEVDIDTAMAVAMTEVDIAGREEKVLAEDKKEQQSINQSSPTKQSSQSRSVWWRKWSRFSVIVFIFVSFNLHCHCMGVEGVPFS